MINFKELNGIPLIISPNLGKPQFISIAKENLETINNFKVELLVIAYMEQDKNQVFEYFKNNIKLQPILKMNFSTKKGERGDFIDGNIIEIITAPLISMFDENLILNYDIEAPRENLVHENIFHNRRKFFILKVQFSLNDELKKLIIVKRNLLFDLVQQIKLKDNKLSNSTYNKKRTIYRINYHSIVLTLQNWENFTIIHATDLHIAKRNDEILGVILKNYDNKLIKNIIKLIKAIINIKRHWPKRSKPIEPIEKRFINPNNNLRLFIKQMNKLYENNLIDFIILTGDLVDFCYCSDNIIDSDEFELYNTNWGVFYNIILNNPIELRKDITPINIFEGEELLVPIFTIIGNHDHREFHYNLRWSLSFKIYNLDPLETLYYKDLQPVSIKKAISFSEKSLYLYHQYINPYKDYFVELGYNLIIFLDSGHDALNHPKDLMFKGIENIFLPILSGFSDEQLYFIKNLIKIKNLKNNYILCCHAPIINPNPFSVLKYKARKVFKSKEIYSLEDLKEEKIKSILKLDEGNLENFIGVRFGTIEKNWKNILDIIQKNKMIVLNGHSHIYQEIRTQPNDEKLLNSNTQIQSNMIKKTRILEFRETNKIPIKIFMDDYSMKQNNSDTLSKNLPMHFHTPPLGVLGRFQNKNITGAFRIINFKNNKIIKTQINSIIEK
ncbi:MAG: metallophosphoesterase [Promethearchaeota archaeon]